MTEETLSKLTDNELLDEAKKMKSSSIMNAGIIGVMIGVILYSVLKNSIGFFTLIPLFFIHKLINGTKNYDALNKVLEERRLK